VLGWWLGRKFSLIECLIGKKCPSSVEWRKKEKYKKNFFLPHRSVNQPSNPMENDANIPMIKLFHLTLSRLQEIF
jgi:hypothetical protein